MRQLPAAEVQAAFSKVGHLIVLDHLTTATTSAAELVIPVAAFTEADGTLIGSEGRAQRFFQVAFPGHPIQESWRWLRDAAREAGLNQDFSWECLDDVIAALSAAHPDLAAIRHAAPGADFRIAGTPIRSETHRFSGRTATDANISVRDLKPEANVDAPSSTTMEGYYGQMPGALIPYLWAPSWNSGNSLNKFQEEVGGAMRGGNPGVRLFDQAGRAAPGYYTDIPEGFAERDGAILVVPQARLFGGEELSAHSASIATRIQPPALGLPPDRARRFGNGVATLSLAGIEVVLPVVADAALPPGTASFPAHAAPFTHFVAAAWGSVT
jgi:NADH-quinone oxidoreductase subunit G